MDNMGDEVIINGICHVVINNRSISCLSMLNLMLSCFY